MQEQNENPDDILTLSQTAKYGHVSRQAIYVAVRKGGIKAKMENKRFYIRRADYDDYRLNKYSREKREINGEKIFDLDKGYLSVLYVSRIIGEYLRRPFQIQHIYYLLRVGQLRGHKVGGVWVIKAEDAQKILEKEMNRDGDQMRFA